MACASTGRGPVTLTIVQGGQTGVDRGAHEGATDNGWPVKGYMPKNRCDELGLIPAAVAASLLPCTISGYPARTSTNLRMVHALLVIVPDKHDPYATPGTRLTLTEAREINLPRLVVDPDEDMRVLGTWIHMLRVRQAREDLRIMVAGPRESRWASGRVDTAALLRRLKIQLNAGPPVRRPTFAADDRQ